MSFSRPLWLLLLLFLPLVLWAGWPRRVAGRRRRTVALAIRSALLLALTLALSGFAWKRPADRLDTVFVVDWSDSLPDEAKGDEVAYVQRALAEMHPDDRAAVVVFGREALVERALSTEETFGAITSLPLTNGSDLEEALRLALALLPPENARRIVALTDGAYTGADPLPIATLIRSSGIDLRFVCYPFGEVADPQECRTPAGGLPDAAVTAVHLPDLTHRGETLKMEVTIQAGGTVTGTLEVHAQDGTLLYRQPYTARPGRDTLTIPLLAEGESGLHTFRVEFIPSTGDFYPQNNNLEAATRLLGEPRLLVVAPPEGEDLRPFSEETRPDEAAALVAALQNAALEVERVLPQGLPFSLEVLSAYAAVILVDVPAAQLTPRQMSALQRYVRDLGGGLIAVGGPTSFGMGGYFRTPLEEALPVEMQIKDERRRPRLALGYVIDHSGSMMETSGGPTKLQLAQEAAIRSVTMLMPGDQVGVVAFDDKASWVVPMQTLEDPAAIQAAIARIGGGGGTDIYAGLLAMSKVLPKTEAQVRHIILLTDGGADPTGIPELVQRMYKEQGVTLTAIGVGADATPALQRWAELGGGRYHFVRDPATLPAIFTTETALVSRSYLVEETFTPLQTAASPLIPAGGLPPLYGYVATEAKQTAQVVLQSPKEDPILAVWRYGLGKALAFTSDATGRWGRDWLRWEGYAPFWETAARAVLGRVQSEQLRTEVRMEGENARLVVLLP
ncbi:MAG TPA: VWA domain-containing protein, partial [Chloroflexi bacterium]|nr:VWA domain-containing protein [Chloroflexota bacterium]